MEIKTAPGPLTSPPAIGEEAHVHGHDLVVAAVDGEKVTLAPPTGDDSGIGLTTMRWRGLVRNEAGEVSAPVTVAHDDTAAGVTPMAEDDPRWERIRRNASNPKAKQAPGLEADLLEMYATVKEG